MREMKAATSVQCDADSLLIVIVNYRTANLTIDCLRSLEAEVQSVPNASVIVTDNCSGDDSCKILAEAIAVQGWQDWVTLQPLLRNGGFSFGNNEAFRAALDSSAPPEFFLLLNPDTVVRPGALRSLLDFLISHPAVGILGSRLEDLDGTAQRSAFRFPSILGELEDGLRLGLATRLLQRWCVAPPSQPRNHPADWVAGASMLVRRQVLEEIGLLDEGYFMYYEEVDFCRRAREVGWECWYQPASRVVHLVGQSSGVTDRKQRRRRPAYWFDSRRNYFLKHHGRAYALLADLVWAAGYSLWRCRRFLQRKEDTDPPLLLVDFIRHSSWVRGFTT
jgi:N-acetylglucosaminyl-diphospho-decaprenol L-rhamnosyltransferase